MWRASVVWLLERQGYSLTVLERNPEAACWRGVGPDGKALLIQALFFGDGGVLAFGANAFNMAFVGPMAGYAVYWTICHRESLTSARRTFAAGLGAYVGLNVAALCTAVGDGRITDDDTVVFWATGGSPALFARRYEAMLTRP